MSAPNPGLNSVPNQPTLSDLLDLLKKEILLGLQSHHIGTIQSFNAALQTAVVTVNYTKTFFQLNKATNLYVATQVNYPTVIDCPCIVLGGGTAKLTFPITKGDECLLLFNDRDMDVWFKTGSASSPPATGRLHSFSDAVALVGLSSTPNIIKLYDATRALLTNGQASVGINPQTNLVTIKTLVGGTLGIQFQTLAASVCIPGAPIAPGVATQILEILE